MWGKIKKIVADWGSGLTFGDYVLRIIGALLPVGGGGYMTWAAAGTEWLHAWGPIGIASAGILGFAVMALTVTAGYAFVGYGRKRSAEAAFRNYLASPNMAVNPLAGRFTGQKIALSDLRIDVSALDFPQRGKIFTDCIIIGPGAIAFAGCNIDPLRFPRSNIARYSPDGYCMPDLYFKECAFINCTFLGVTVFFNEADCEIFRERLPNYKFADEALFRTPEADDAKPAQLSDRGLVEASEDQSTDNR